MFRGRSKLTHYPRATMLARYTDDRGRRLRQRELCNRHTDWLKVNRPNVHDLRGAPDAEKTVKDSLKDYNAALDIVLPRLICS